jgi:hypothetical protein
MGHLQFLWGGVGPSLLLWMICPSSLRLVPVLSAPSWQLRMGGSCAAIQLELALCCPPEFVGSFWGRGGVLLRVLLVLV